jgi:hypothetical protein
MHIDPQQELFAALKVGLEAKGHTVYDGALPPDGTPYPFDYIGDFQQTDREHKNAVTGSVLATLHVWHNNTRQRGTLSKMLLEVKEVCRSTQKTNNFSWFVRNITQRIIPDTATAEPLLHGIIEAEFYFS